MAKASKCSRPDHPQVQGGLQEKLFPLVKLSEMAGRMPARLLAALGWALH
jgi:hypothetical protein